MFLPSWTQDVWEFSKRNIIPDLFIKRRFNFITIHYLYVIGMTLLMSVIIYGIGDIAYVDALFFASGGATQSGLNTVDVNLLRTGQQAMLYIGAMLCNPIVVHSFVVFVRLYWFEKRFKDVVMEARKLRRTRSKTRVNTFSKEDPEQGTGTRGFKKRGMTFIHNATPTFLRQNQTRGKEKQEDGPETDAKVVESSNSSNQEHDQLNEKRRDDHLRLQTTRSTEDVRLPQLLSPEQHIRFLENQRNPDDPTTLRIPSPREFERGSRPMNVPDDVEGPLLRQVTSEPNLPSSSEKRSIELNPRPEGAATHITIDEPRFLRDRNDKSTTFPRLNTRQSTIPQNQDGVEPGLHARPTRSNTFRSLRRSNTARTTDPAPAPYLSWQPTIGRNSFFFDLTEEQREELGGIEYRALKTLALILVGYFFLFHLLAVVCLTPWIVHSGTYSAVLEAVSQNRVWWGVFTSGSAFNDLGFTLTPDSMLSFNEAVFPLLLMTFLIIIGNTGFPCMLRFVIWAISKVVSEGCPLWEELRFLLDHPRRCFTLLFPGSATWVLLGILVVLNGVDLIFFIILDLNDPTVTQLPGGIRFLDGLFQAASTRTAGFSVVNLAELHPAIQVSYLVMMYISVFPIAISMRRTNVYEEKSLGVYNNPSEEEDDEKQASYVGAHLRRQLSFDLWYVFMGLFLIAIVEGGRLESTNEYAFTLFSVLFEIVSAYGTVGLSLGYPTVNTSFSGQFRTLSKLIVIAMQIRGRHRGLPYELDRAILLPSESLQQKEIKEGNRIVLRRRRSSAAQSLMSAVDGNLEGQQFRPETGIASGHHAGESDQLQLRPRTNTNRTVGSSASGSEQQHGPHSNLRHGLGNGMHKVQEVIDPIKEEEKGSE
ncbi:uncharacterized protein A1O9_01445 [Exophiala aquamarina CBS 119918]|uniref:Potassium transport protein n=1 Tax=Exophiala aquamarina CBS 119918 TaxID=1182545 RepID=A0A072PUN4_9EURO|nr:uncharacterized protein A1O9_01445 [Exophiala aquamarina CBS 119918]KEF63467.1 hypothetical protein A1O9_01445 [Exophiala aquamarina CBS 119918]